MGYVVVRRRRRRERVIASSSKLYKMKPEDIVGEMQDLEKILSEASKVSSPIVQPRANQPRAAKVKIPSVIYKGPDDNDDADEESQPDYSEPVSSPTGPSNSQSFPESQYPDDNLGPYPAGSDRTRNYDSPYFADSDYYTKNGELSSHELGRLLQKNIWGFAMGVLMNTYYDAVDQGMEEEATFIRTDVQNFVQQKGRHKFRSIPYQSIQDFIDECVGSSDVLDNDEYMLEKYSRESFSCGTVDALIKKADGYHEARRKGEFSELDEFGRDGNY